MMMPIMILVTFDIFLFEGILGNVKSLARWVQSSANTQGKKINSLLSKIKELKDDQCHISPQDEFAKHAKLQRRINKLNDELSSAVNDRNTAQLKLEWIFKVIIYTIYSISVISLFLLYRHEPMTSIPESWLWPIGRFLSFYLSSKDSMNTVSLPAWIIISRVTARLLFS